jgi:hypothetical protein
LCNGSRLLKGFLHEEFLEKGAMVILALLLMGLVFAQSPIIRLGVPVDFGGVITLSDSSGSISSNPNTGYGVSAEVLYPVLSWLQVGGGLDVELPRSEGANYVDSFNFTSIYGTARALYTVGGVSPYAITRLGYGFPGGFNPTWTSTGGLDFFIGAGVDFPMFESISLFLEGGIALNSAGATKAGWLPETVVYSRFQARAGVSFSI